MFFFLFMNYIDIRIGCVCSCVVFIYHRSYTNEYVFFPYPVNIEIIIIYEDQERKREYIRSIFRILTFYNMEKESYINGAAVRALVGHRTHIHM